MTGGDEGGEEVIGKEGFLSPGAQKEPRLEPGIGIAEERREGEDVEASVPRLAVPTRNTGRPRRIVAILDDSIVVLLDDDERFACE